MLNKKKLSHYLDHNLNVLLIGTHGLAKTAIVKSVFEEKKLNWKYFSASTMDPWIDFIGVPKTVERGGKEVLELIKPAEFENDEIEAIFFDEFNRAPKKVINAVMELIQFKSINGKGYKNLKVVWAAINPHDEQNTYAVEKLDPSVMDRFHIHINVPLELDVMYLTSVYGETAKPFIRWWNELPQGLKLEVSPRRLDYAMHVYSIKGSLRDVLPKESNVKKLEDNIRETQNANILLEISKKSEGEIRSFFGIENSAKHLEEILNNKKLSYLVKYLNSEFIEKNIQEIKPSKMKSMLINQAAVDDSLFESLTQKSKEVVRETTKADLLALPPKTSHTTEGLIKKTIDNNYMRGTKVFINKMNAVFKTFFNEISSQKSSELYSFFDVVFDDHLRANPDKMAQIQSKLENLKNKSTYVSKNKGDMLFLGLFVNFMHKYNLGIEKSAEQTAEKIYQHFTTKADSEFYMGYEEKNWFVIKELMNKKYDHDKTLNSTAYKSARAQMIAAEGLRSEDDKPPTPSSIEETRKYFQKEALKPTAIQKR